MMKMVLPDGLKRLINLANVSQVFEFGRKSIPNNNYDFFLFFRMNWCTLKHMGMKFSLSIKY